MQTTRCVSTSSKKRIELFTEMALLSIDASLVHNKVIIRLKSRRAMFNEQWVNEDRQSLMAEKNWMYKLKTYMFDLQDRVIQVEKVFIFFVYK